MTEPVVGALVFALNAVTYLLDWITWLPYFVVQRPDQKKLKSARIKAASVTGDPAGPWRSLNVLHSPLSTTMLPGCATLADLFRHACKQFSDQNSLGTREVLSEEEEKQPNGKVFKKVVLGKYVWSTYKEVEERVSNLGSGLYALGQQPGARLVVFAETRAEWMITAQACFRNNFPVVTLYSTLGIEAIRHGIKQTEVTHVFTSIDLLPKFEEVLPYTPKVTHIIVMCTSRQQLDNVHLTASERGVAVFAVQDVEKLGAEPANKAASEALKGPSPDDTAVIMYTSGSTGLPKGVIISHRNLMCGTSGQTERIPNLGEQDIYIGYLPLAHVLELTAEVSCVAKGTQIGYSSPSTLTDNSTKIKKGSQGDVSVLKPTLIAAVPVILDRIYKTVWEKIKSGSIVGKVLFGFAYEYKLKHLVNGYDTPLLNNLVFKKTKALLGGRVRLVLSGGAPLSNATQRFMNICLCCPVGQGYGLTETSGAGTVIEFTDRTSERVGHPLICCEIQLRDWDEGNYKSSNKPHPQGEVLIGGGNISLGYFQDKEKTEEDFIVLNKVRYFCTGDIGQFDSDGSLRIIDRKKDLVKLQHGEYISLAQVETVLKMCPVVEQICVVAHSHQMNVVALVVPNQPRLHDLAKDLKLQEEAVSSLCADKNIVAAVLKQITAHGLKGKLQRVEIPIRIHLIPEPWMPDSGLVTDSFKLKRKVIEEHYREMISTMYTT